jgi:hypothetical protein
MPLLSVPVSTNNRWRTAVGGSGGPGHDFDSCTSVAASRSSDRPAVGFPVDSSSGPHRCGPRPTQGAGPTTRWRRRRLRNSLPERRRDIAECSGRHGCQSAPRRIRANVRYSTCVGATPDMHYRSRSSDCATKVVNHSRDTVSHVRRYDLPPTTSGRQVKPRVEPPIGIEPMAYVLQVRCSTTELRRPAAALAYRLTRRRRTPVVTSPDASVSAHGAACRGTESGRRCCSAD